MGTAPIRATDHIGNSLSPCSPMIEACTLAVEMRARSAIRRRSRDESSTVPLEITRLVGRPEMRCATIVSTSHGLVTRMKIASGEASTSLGIIAFRMRALSLTSSRRLWPGFCLAPAVITTMSLPLVTAMSLLPLTWGQPVKCEPCARSAASASTLGVLMSYRAISLAT